MPSPAEDALRGALAHHRAGRLAEAAAAYRAAIAPGRDSAALRGNLALALRGLGRMEEAATEYRAALALAPGDPRMLGGLADVLVALGRLAEAAEALAAAIDAAPDPDAVRMRLAGLQARQHRPDLVIRTLGAVDPAGPHAAVMRNNLGNALMAVGRPQAALAELAAAAALLPDRPEIVVNMAQALMAAGRPAEAAQACAGVLARHPANWPAWHNRLMALNYLPEVSPAAIAAEHRRFGDALAAAVAPMPAPANPRDPDKRLRIGFVSGDFRTHSVGHFLEGVLAAHDREGFALVAYANQAAEDAATARMRPRFAAWRQVAALDDAALAEAVRADGIDILVDLSGHTGHTRIETFARRPAPVQAAWIGYPQTTGVAAMDWIIADARALPPQDEALYRERVMRLPGCYLCYAGPLPGPPPATAPRSAPVFACFNGLAKLNDEVLATWARILDGVPGARLLVKTRALGEEATAAAFRARFVAQGGDPARLDLEGHLAAAAHAARFAAVDLMLDPFPYGGCTSTMEALAAGVPCLALRGRGGMMTRSGETLLAAAGLPDWVAPDLDAYCRIAVLAGREPDRLAAARARLRLDALCDAARFCRGLEEAWRAMWREWCARPG